MKRNKQVDINSTIALAGSFNFLYSCARACIFPFLTLYFRQLGLTPEMAGIIVGTKHLISLVWTPLASLLSKRYNKRRVVIIGSLLCSAAVVLLVLLIPNTDVNTRTSYCNMFDLSNSSSKDLSDYQPLSSVGPTKPTVTRTRANISTAFVTRSSVIPPTKTLSDTKSTRKVSLDMLKQHQDPNERSHPQLSQRRTSVVVSSSFVQPEVSSSSVAQSTSRQSSPVRSKRSLAKLEDEQQERDLGEGITRFEFLGSLNVMDVQHQLFFLMLIIVSIWEFVSAPLEWTADDGLYEYLDFVDAADRYRNTGVWGLLGAACGVGGVGLLVSRLNCLIGGQTSRSAVHFYCYAGLTVLALPMVAFLPLYLNKKHGKANGLVKAAQLVLGHTRAMICAATVFMVGITNSAVDNFLLWEMQDHGSSELHMGVSLASALLSQAAFPLLAVRVSKLFSPGRLLIVGALSLALQCLYFSFLWGPWAVLPAQLLSCFSSGALWWAVQIQCEDVTTSGAERSVRRIYRTFSLDLGAGLGSLASGFVVRRFGVAWLFRGAAAALIAWCLCLPLLQRRAPHQRRINYSRLLAADASEASDSESEQERDWLNKAMNDDDESNNKYGKR
ncbi:major facilitator superfamily domain-containing protein 6-like [Lampris incognitus]|uniref:major facilitator superfamily domain-containing protein 6-like n=1 Tax=Lampris incognitus TaxID=2546036 RepID=UPI0024B4C5A5|nr:major facilitator superfamily domain-containing protein 6-like [Lampris incognitus]